MIIKKFLYEIVWIYGVEILFWEYFVDKFIYSWFWQIVFVKYVLEIFFLEYFCGKLIKDIIYKIIWLKIIWRFLKDFGIQFLFFGHWIIFKRFNICLGFDYNIDEENCVYKM
jgi:hypothetical protein